MALLPPNYTWQVGVRQDREAVQRWLQATLQEAFPEQQQWGHLRSTVKRLYEPPATPCWWIHHQRDPVGCIWLGTSIDQVSDRRQGYVFLLRVDPSHRRRGLGRALVQQAAEWAQQQALAGLSLQVFAHNHAALGLYAQTGFQIQGYWLLKPLSQGGDRGACDLF